MFYIAGNSVRALIPSGLTQPFIFLRQIDRVSCTLLCEGFQVRPCKMQFYIFLSGSEDVVSFFFFPSGYVCLNILEDVWVFLSPSVSQWSVSQTAKELFPTRGYFRTRQIWRACFSDLSWSKLRKHHRCPSSSEFLGKAHFDHGQATVSQCPQMSSDTSVSAVCLMQVHPTADRLGNPQVKVMLLLIKLGRCISTFNLLIYLFIYFYLFCFVK